MPGGRFGPEHVNVEDQKRDTDSLLRWFQLLIERYRECPELAWGEYEPLDAGHPAVHAHRSDADGATVVAVHNLGDEAVEAEVELDGLAGSLLTDLLVDGTVEVPESGPVRLPLDPYGTRWLRVSARKKPAEDASIKAH
ncbi:hypothetical protein ACFQE7_31225 [Nonomuraea ferruginea]